MAYYRICPECGSALAPGEACDCRKNAEKEAAPAATGTTSDKNIHNKNTKNSGNCQAKRGGAHG